MNLSAKRSPFLVLTKTTYNVPGLNLLVSIAKVFFVLAINSIFSIFNISLPQRSLIINSTSCPPFDIRSTRASLLSKLYATLSVSEEFGASGPPSSKFPTSATNRTSMVMEVSMSTGIDKARLSMSKAYSKPFKSSVSEK